MMLAASAPAKELKNVLEHIFPLETVMIEKIPLKNIKPNPYNARTDYTDEDIAELAKEIEEVGLWKGALRGRRVDGKVELCFGHRRLAALKKLRWDEAEVDIQKLDDDEMAMQSLIENLQRRGLNDMEKANGIAALVGQLSKKLGTKEDAYGRVAHMLGLKVDWVKSLAAVTKFEAPVKKLIEEKKITAKTAMQARRIGGNQYALEMVKTAAREQIPLHTLSKINQAISKVADEKARENLRAKVATGKIIDPKEVERKAIEANTAKATKKNPPPDLLEVIVRWTDSIRGWRQQLRDVIPYRSYLDKAPDVTNEFRSEVRGLISELEKLL